MLGLSASHRLMLVLFAVPASEGALAFFNTVVLAVPQADTPGRLRVQARRAGRGAHAGGRAVADRLARRCRGKRSATSKSIICQTPDEIHFALLSDWPDSEIEIDAIGHEILEYARAEIARLNARYPREAAPRFYLLHRAPALQRGRRKLDGLGAQARQAARTQPAAARRQRHDFPAGRRAAAGKKSSM